MSPPSVVRNVAMASLKAMKSATAADQEDVATILAAIPQHVDSKTEQSVTIQTRRVAPAASLLQPGPCAERAREHVILQKRVPVHLVPVL